MEPLVSVVTPAYNEEHFIARCIESVLAQTYQNWEYLIVNNCSTDKTLEVARRYAQRDARIKIYQNDSLLPAVANFNHALRQISPISKYCKMVFADDMIFPDCLRLMVEVAEQNPSAGIVGAYGMKGSREIWCTGIEFPKRCASGLEVGRGYLLGEFFVFGSSTSVMYRSDIVRKKDQFFDEGNLHSDTDTALALVKSCDFGFVHQILTFTNMRPESLFSFSTRMNTFIPGRLHELLSHGPDFLTPQELQRRTKEIQRQYYRFLSERLPWQRGPEFWKYHRSKMAELGMRISRTRVARGVIRRTIGAVTHQLRNILVGS